MALKSAYISNLGFQLMSCKLLPVYGRTGRLKDAIQNAMQFKWLCRTKQSIVSMLHWKTMGQWGRATLRTRLWGRDFEDRRLWGHATLRTDDFEDKYYKVFWGQKFCPQSRIKMRLWGQTFKNWQDLQKIPKILDIRCQHFGNICNLEGFWAPLGRRVGESM